MRKNLISASLLIILLAFLSGMYWKESQGFTETFSVHAITEDEVKNELIIAIFIESIRGHVNNFYSEFYTGQIAVYNYETEILRIEKKDGYIFIKFGVTPQVGAHNPLGYDELQYKIDSSGSGQLANYEHIKNYTVPERFEEYIIKPTE